MEFAALLNVPLTTFQGYEMARVMQAAIRAVHGRTHDPDHYARVQEILDSCRRASAELDEEH